jgi:hypothetical protein
MTERILQCLAILLVVAIIIYQFATIMPIYSSRQREQCYDHKWETSELEFRELPETMVWARPHPEHQPEYWQDIRKNEWQFAFQYEDGTWKLIPASLRPPSTPS